jgi:two-component system osmolarity sensor histidine kinase EnvZ
MLVGEILEYVRNKEELPSRSQEWIDVRKAIEPLSKALAEESPHLNLEFESNIPGQIPLIYADRIAFVRVAKNIIGNAQRYANSRLIVRAYQVPMEATDRHQASLSTPQSQTCVEFEDDGLGIPEDKWRDVIEPFVRISDPNSGVPGISSHGHSRNHSGHKNHTGIGLGLAIVNRILQQHGGSIQIGRGTSGGCIVRTYWLNPASQPPMV